MGEMFADFLEMKVRGAWTVITFEFCGDGADASYYDGLSFSPFLQSKY